MIYPQEIIEEVRMLNDIADVISGYVALRPSGGRLFGLCPFHREKSASFSVSPDQQMFYCFGCQAGGNVFSFIMKIENFDFPDALKFLADRAHFTLPQTGQSSEAYRNKARIREEIAAINTIAARFFYDCLQADGPEAKAARLYLYERGVNPKIRTRYGIGLSPPGWDGLLKHLTERGYKPEMLQEAGLTVKSHDRFRGRLMFPILDLNGQVAGFGGRVLDGGEPKYLNSPETPLFNKSRILYGLNLARKAKSKEIIIVEGYMDAISLAQAGFRNTAGVLGTAFTADHARLLKKVNCDSVILLLDSDEAGTKAALRAIPVLLEGGLKVRVLQVEGAKDPDEYIRLNGPERFAALLEGARGHITFRVGLLRKKYSLDKTDQRVLFTQEAAALLATLQSAIETDAYAAEIAAMTGISQEAIKTETERRRAMDINAPRPAIRAFRQTGNRQNDDKGLRDAQNGLIGLLYAQPSVHKALRTGNTLTPQEMADPVAARLLEIAFQNKEPPAAANAINHFVTLEEQQSAAEMLRGGTQYDSNAETEKAVTDMVLKIKQAYLERRIFLLENDSEVDMEQLNILSKAFKNLRLLHITIADG